MTWQEQLLDGIGYQVEDIAITSDDISTPSALTDWLTSQATTNSILLAHSDDGVIWGYMTDEQLLLSSQADAKVSPQLRPATLQQLWLFDEQTQLHLWPDGFNWSARRVQEVDDAQAAALDEEHLLWGTLATPKSNGFTLLEDGVQGLRHLPPSHIFGRGYGPILRDRVYLQIRHYLTPDDKGVNSISMSRLVKLGQLNHGEK
jgi:CRISPR-associated protein (TIGR03984 family)